MRLQAMVGYKLFKEFDDGIKMIRIAHVRKRKHGDPAEIIIIDEGTGEKKKVKVSDLEGYTPLEPDGLLTFNISGLITEKGKTVNDVVVTASKFLNLKIGDTLPYAVCRQNITDIFYNLLVSDESEMIVGLAVNQDDCPTNFRFETMLIASDISYSDHVNFYRTDKLEDLYQFINEDRFDDVLTGLFTIHVNTVGDPSIAFKNEDKGWCKNLRTLLKENNFQNDIDQMLGITSVEFKVEDYFMDKILPGTEDEKYTSITDDLKSWLSSTFRVGINNVTVIEYNHDINLAEFNNARYFLIRDTTNKVYLFAYTCSGEYHEVDLQKESEKQDFSTKFRINFYNKYKNIKK